MMTFFEVGGYFNWINYDDPKSSKSRSVLPSGKMSKWKYHKSITSTMCRGVIKKVKRNGDLIVRLEPMKP